MVDDAIVKVDGKVVLDLAGKSTWDAHARRNLVGFGSLSSAATGEAWWDRVTWCAQQPEVEVYPRAQHHIVFKQEGMRYPLKISINFVWYGTCDLESATPEVAGPAQGVDIWLGQTDAELVHLLGIRQMSFLLQLQHSECVCYLGNAEVVFRLCPSQARPRSPHNLTNINQVHLPAFAGVRGFEHNQAAVGTASRV